MRELTQNTHDYEGEGQLPLGERKRLLALLAHELAEDMIGQDLPFFVDAFSTPTGSTIIQIGDLRGDEKGDDSELQRKYSRLLEAIEAKADELEMPWTFTGPFNNEGIWTTRYEFENGI